MKLNRFFVYCGGIKKKFAATSHRIFLILGDRAKKYVEKFYTRCRDILQSAIQVFEFWLKLSGSPSHEASQQI
jgi:hypothetical protein